MNKNKFLTLDRDILTCPHCANEQLHQSKIEVFLNLENWENSQNIKPCSHISIGNFVEQPEDGFDRFDNNLVIDDNMKNNPSSYRQGLLVHFNCEECCKHSVLSISQHKGATIVEWVVGEAK